MKTLILSLSCLIGIASFAQNLRPPTPAKNIIPNGVVVDSLTGQTVVCKGTSIPDGLVVSGEIFTDSCQGSAWIVKPKPGSPLALDVTTSRLTSDISYSAAAAEEVVKPGQCDSFQPDDKADLQFQAGKL